MPLTKSTVATIDQRAKDDPDFAAAVEEGLRAKRIEHDLGALRNAGGLSQRQRAVKAMNGSIEVSITPKEHRGRTRRPVAGKR